MSTEPVNKSQWICGRSPGRWFVSFFSVEEESSKRWAAFCEAYLMGCKITWQFPFSFTRVPPSSNYHIRPCARPWALANIGSTKSKRQFLRMGETMVSGVEICKDSGEHFYIGIASLSIIIWAFI
ncbi:hypothetical protein NPIL_411711 [Nephila pilipes]|uniref:Uncharacterized protein n=1 Tax=Nephila pilipes TaxID=299642 RepID=A0A8X6JPL6_NEPPI|nr:hypothetical protein NPIL_411711 [Nephila pilipes]